MTNIHIHAYGSVGDGLKISVNENEIGRVAFLAIPGDENPQHGYLDHDFTITSQEPLETARIKFEAYGYGAFMMDDFRVGQDLKKGQVAYTLLQQAEVAGGDVTEYTFSELDQFPFTQFAYNVTAYYDRTENEVAVSNPSAYAYVSLDGTEPFLTSVLALEDALGGNNAVVLERYAADGRRLAEPCKGLNIVKMSDGRVVKYMVK